MSRENENQIESKSAVICDICEDAITDDKSRLVCPNKSCGKLTCLSCIKKMIDIMFGQPTLNYPFKCGVCSQISDQCFFDDIIVKLDQYDKFIACILPLYWAKDCLEQNEKLAQCKCLK